MNPRNKAVASYYLRTPDGTIYGPVDIATLCIWATDARVIPGCDLSEKRDTWFSVEDIDELRLNWSVQFDDGTLYGPLNLLAVRLLASENSIPAGVTLIEKGSGRKVVLNDSLLPLFVEECHHILASCGSLMRDTLGALSRSESTSRDLESLRANLDTAVTTLAGRDAQLEAMRLRLGQAETDLAANLKLVSETQRRLAGYAEQVAQAGADNRTNEELSRTLADVRADVADRQAREEDLLAKLAQGESALSLALTDVADFQKKLRVAESAGLDARHRAEEAEAARGALSILLAERGTSLAELQKKVEQGEKTEAERATIALELVEIKRAFEAMASRRQQEEDACSAAQAEARELAGKLDNAKTRIVELEARIREAETLRVELSSARDELSLSKASREALDLKLRDTNLHVEDLENQKRKLESFLETSKAQYEKDSTEIISKTALLEKNLHLEKQRAASLVSQLAQTASQLAQAKDEVNIAHQAGRAAEIKLKDDLAGVQRDLKGLLLASRCVKQVTGIEKPKRKSIDWISGGTSRGHNDGDAASDLETRFDRMTLAEKLSFLQKELQDSAEQKETLRHDLENVKGRYEFLQKESLRKEQEAEDKISHIQKELHHSSELVAQTLQEVEKREGQLRAMRKRNDERERHLSGKPAVIEKQAIHAEVLHAEVIGVDAADSITPDPVVTDDARKKSAKGETKAGAGMLSNMEARIQAELRQWEVLKREKENQKGTFGKWFRRK
ncbi:MAG: hypothetical protein WCO42_10150 [bacterium]